DALPEVLGRDGAVDLRQRRRFSDLQALARERRGGWRRLRRGRGRRRDDWRRRVRDGNGLRRRLGFRRGRRDAAREHEEQRRESGDSQKVFFQSRIAANTRTGSARRLPRYLFADSITAGSRQRRKGLVAFSSPSRLGSVGLPSARSLRSRTSRWSSAVLPGSTALAKPMLASVYSCPQ